jgi:hypothetical protein
MMPRIASWEPDFSIPPFAMPEFSDEVQPHIPWFDAGQKPLTGTQDIPSEHRLKVTNKFVALYRKLTPSNALLLHQLSKEEEETLYKTHQTRSAYDAGFVDRFRCLSIQIEFL